MNKQKLKKIIEIILFVFIVIQPIFDLKIFYNSISTLIRTIVIGILFIIYFFLDKNKKKWWFVPYVIAIIIYFVFHHMNALNFKSLVPGNFEYSILEEALYFIKMMMPFCLIYILYHSDISYTKVIKIIVFTMSCVIIISNLFLFSYGSYSDVTIKGNIFSWFTESEYTFFDLASKGLFEYANQISAVLLMFLAVLLYEVLENRKLKEIGLLCCNILALLMLGTKVAVLGIFIVFCYTVFLWLIKQVKNRTFQKKSLKAPAIILVCYLLLLPANPAFNRMEVQNNAIETAAPIVIEDEKEINEQEQEQYKENIAEKENTEQKQSEELYPKDTGIHEIFIRDAYPYQYDKEFWNGIFKLDANLRIDFRYLEKAMIKRVVEINNNPGDKYFGITNTRLQNIFNIEQDFIVQYYAIGIIGTILVLSPYGVILGYSVYKMIKKRKIEIPYLEIMLFLSISMMFCISYFSGNLLNSLSFTIYFAILFAFLLKQKV